MLRILRDMQRDMHYNSTANCNRDGKGGGGCGGQQRKRSLKTPDNASFPRQMIGI